MPFHVSNVASYGVISVWNSTSYTYEQRDKSGNVIDKYVYNVPEPDEESKSWFTKKKLVTFFVLACTLVFLGYVTYVWLVFYRKRESDEELQRLRRSEEGGYAMQRI